MGDFVRTTKQRDKVQAKHNSEDLTLSVCLRGRDNITYPKVYTECKWLPICMKWP